MLNIVYNDEDYYIYHPGNVEKKSHINQIDNFLWKIIKFAPLGTVKLREGDVIRFGRIPFKVSCICFGMTDDLDYGPGRIQLPNQPEEMKELDITQTPLEEV